MGMGEDAGMVAERARAYGCVAIFSTCVFYFTNCEYYGG